jgi:hypothetical protein
MPNSKNSKLKKEEDVAAAGVVQTEQTEQTEQSVPKMKKLFSHKKGGAKVAVDQNDVDTETDTATHAEESVAQPSEQKAAKKKRVKKDATASADADADVKPKTKRAKKDTISGGDENSQPKSKQSGKVKADAEADAEEETETSAAGVESDDAVDIPKKRKNSKKVRDPSAPKRPLSSFMVFSGIHRPEVKQSNPELKATQIATKLGEMWGLLTDEQKATFKSPAVVSVVVSSNDSESLAESPLKPAVIKRQKKVKVAKTEKDEKAERDEKAEKKAKKAKKAEKKARKAQKALNPDAPPKKLSSFMLFSNERRKDVQSAHPEFKITQVAQELGIMWRQLSDDEKSKYNIIVIEPSSVPAVAPALEAVLPIETF